MESLKERLQAAVGDRYRIEEEIGQGGMATVFVAEDLKHHRRVAVKVLMQALAHTIGIRRFLLEIEVIARLQHPHLLTLFDSGDVGGLPYYVMPYLEAQSLRELVSRTGKLPVEQAVAIAREVADGLQYAHEHGIIHRDVKPSNILMSGGHAVVADFGIATALEKAAVGRLTETGISMGSPTYMSPEQAAGERDLDARTDVYSLACVLYEMLCAKPPVDDPSMQRVVTAKLTGHFRPVRSHRPDVPEPLEAAIHKALSSEREARFESMAAFSQAIADAIAAQRKPVSRRVLAAGAAAAVVVALGIFQWNARRERVLEATRLIPEITRLASNGEYAAAFAKAEDVWAVLPRDARLAEVSPIFADYLKIVTDPPGARVFRRHEGDASGEWELLGRTPLDSVRMPKFGSDLTYRLRIEAPGYRTAEVLPNLFANWAEWRGIPAFDTLRLDRADEASEGMVRIPGWKVPDPLHPGGDSLVLADYHIGATEVTNAQFKRFVDAGGYDKREFWVEPLVRDGRELPWEEVRALLRDRSGLPGPATWSNGTYPDGQADYPVGGVSWYEAAAYARFAGVRIPTAAHWARAALRHDREVSWIYRPTSNLNATGPRRVGGGVANAFGLYDVAGNVREWTWNPLEEGRLTRGAGWEDSDFHVGHLIPKPEFDRSPSNGFRVMSTTDHDTTLAHLARRLTRVPPRDYGSAVAVGDAEYRFFQRLFAYDSLPLEARVDTAGVSEHYRWEKVTFTAAYGGERMGAYVFLPKDAEPPYQPVILWHGSGALVARSVFSMFAGVNFEDQLIGKPLGFITRGGRALVLPLFKGTFERDDSAFSIVGEGLAESPNQRDLVVQWIKDLRRTVDYVATRPDIAAQRIGFYGWSWGGQIAPMALALEPRISAAVLNVAGLRVTGNPLPEVDQVNYLPRVRTPVLMLSGRHDIVFPYQSSQVPFYQRLGTPPDHKKHIVYPTSHTVPQEDNARETLAWFDKYLGAVKRFP